MPDPKMKLPPGAQLVDDSSSIKLPPGAELVQDTPDFTANEKGEGTYEMAGPEGKKVKIPFSMISTASQAGYRMTNDDILRYLKDKKNEGVPSAASRYGSSVKEEVGNAVKGVGAFLDPRPSEDEKKRGLTTPYDTIMRYPHRIVTPNADLMSRATDEAKKGDYVSAGLHGAASLVPMLGPWAVQIGEKSGQQAAEGNWAGAAGTLVGNAVVAEAPKFIGEGATKTVAAARNSTPIRSGVEAITKTGPRELLELAKKTHENNVNAAQEHLDASQKAAEDTRGKEIGHGVEEKDANAKAYADHEDNVAKVKADNQKVTEKYKKEVEGVKDHNEKIKAKHEKDAKQVQQENSGVEHALELRRQREAQLQKETDAYYAKEDAVKAKAKNAENAAWQPWHDKMQAVTVDGSDIAGPLAKITEVSPEVSRAIRQLIPDASDAAPDSLFAQDRAAVMKTQGFKGSYWDLPPDLRAQVDSITASNGFEPEPIDFNPQTGQAIPVEQIHRAQSIIGRNIASGRYEGPLLGEMKQLYKVLDQAKTRASMNAGSLSDLTVAKKATTEYQKAFGKERHIPKTQDEIRKQQANPDQFKEENDQERLDAAKKHDPTLATDYEKVKNQREQLKKMKTEDELRKSLQQVPPPPSVGDLREGYNLKKDPEAPVTTRRDTAGNLFQLKNGNWVAADEKGIKHQLSVEPPEPILTVKGADGQMQRFRNGKWESIPQPRPEALNSPTPESVQIERPDRTPQPNRPVDEKADLSADRAKLAKEAADRVRSNGIARSQNALFYTVPSAIITAFLGHPLIGAVEASTAPMILVGSQAVANLIERPAVVRWISRVTPKDVAAWETLPPEQKAVFAQNMSAVAKAAKKKGLNVSPAMSAFIASSPASQPKKKATPKELLEQARRNLHSDFQQQGLAP